MKKLIIFDLDGTLLDTIEDIRVTLNFVLTEYNLPTLTKEEVIKKTGYGAKKLVELAVGDIDNGTFEEIYFKYANRLKNCNNENTNLYGGLSEILIKLKNDGYRLAVVSNKPDDAVKAVCNDKLSGYGFEFFMGNIAGAFNPKPDKSCVEYCLNKLGVKTKEAIYVGDSEVDVQTFLNAGLDGIAVLWGFRSESVLRSAGATNIAKDAGELYKIIKSFK